MTILRITAGTALIATLAACGGGDFTVRDGPQAIHPSGSFLANGTYLPVEEGDIAVPPACHHNAHTCHANSGHQQSYTSYTGNDGSSPIID